MSKESTAVEPVAETEKGFGSGLRAQLQRKRGEEVEPQVDATESATETESETESETEHATAVVEPTVEVAAEYESHAFVAPVDHPAEAAVSTPPSPQLQAAHDALLSETTSLRADLATAMAREAGIRRTFTERFEAQERGLDMDHELAVRASELDDRGAKLAASGAGLEERERRVTERSAELEEQRRRAHALQEELAAEQAYSAERVARIETRQEELRAAEAEHQRLTADRSKEIAALSDREKRATRAEAQFQSREREERARLEVRERSMTERENALKARERALREQDGLIAGREQELSKQEARISARDETLGEREAELLAKNERLRNQAERMEREYAGKDRQAQVAVVRAGEIDARDADLAARERELELRIEAVQRTEEVDSPQPRPGLPRRAPGSEGARRHVAGGCPLELREHVLDPDRAAGSP